MITHRLLHEPLLHFLLIGAALFGVYQWLNSDAAGQGSAGEIVVSEGRIRSLAETFTRTWQRPPTPAELDGLVEDYIREDVLYREAVTLSLDRDDTIVRRRLRQKLEFISEDALADEEPAEQALAEFLAANPDKYSVESRLSFMQVFLDPSKRGERLEADAAGLLDVLRKGGRDIDPATAGDSLMLDDRYEHLSETDIGRLFGESFAAALREPPLGQWFGPVRSGYGAHLVRIEARTPGRLAELSEVRAAVARDWASRRRQLQLDAQYQALRKRYRITVKTPSAAKDKVAMGAASSDE